MVTKDFLIVGGGVIGLASALALRRAGASVAVIDAGSTGAGASWAGGGILSPLLPWEYASPVAQLAARGAAMYEAWTGELREISGVDSEYERSGMVVLAPYDIERAEQWALSSQTALKTGVSWLDGAPMLELASVAQVRNPRLLAALSASARASGIEIIEHTPVERLIVEGESVQKLLTRNGEFHGGAFVIAAGAWSPALVPGVELAIKPIRGQMLLFGTGAKPLERIIYRDGIYLIPRRDGQVLVGSTREDVGFDSSTTEAARAHLFENALEIWPSLSQAALLRHWAGLRPMRPNNAPIIGPHPSLKNLFINAGHGRYGLTMAPASAEILLRQTGLATSTEPFDYAFELGTGHQLDKVQIVG